MCRFKVLVVLGVMFGLVLSVQAAWYWPFDFDPDSTNKPPRLHRLLEKANEYIELAEDEALDGNGDKAIENYRLALRELDRIEDENPDRAESPEFAPLRNKRATCSAAIDSIRFAQVNENERAVSVTNTRELERKWRKKHNKMTPEDIALEKKEADEKKAQEEKKRGEEKNAKAEKEPEKEKDAKAEKEPEKENTVKEEKASEEKPRPVAEEMDSAEENAPAPTGIVRESVVEKKPELSVVAETPRREGKKETPTSTEDDFQVRLRAAYEKVRSGNFATADVLLEKLEKERPADLNILLLRAASQSGGGSFYAARRTLERAMRAHPRSYKPYYNLAGIALKLGEGTSVAREYYELGRAVGGPVDAALEGKLK